MVTRLTVARYNHMNEPPMSTKLNMLLISPPIGHDSNSSRRAMERKKKRVGVDGPGTRRRFPGAAAAPFPENLSP